MTPELAIVPANEASWEDLQARLTKSKIACFAAPSRQLASAPVIDGLAISVSEPINRP